MTENTENRISAVIPAYNAEKTITDCILSVLNQTVPITEIIVVDDGSTDKTGSILKEMQQQYKKIRIIHTENFGVAHARNVGIEASSGNLIAFLDSDDCWQPEKTIKQLEILAQNTDSALVCTASTIHKSVQIGPIAHNITFRSLLYKNSIVTSSVLVKKEILPIPAFNEKLSRAEDYNLWLKLAKTQKFCKLEEPLVIFAEKTAYGSSGLSKNLHIFERNELLNFYNLYKEHYITLGQLICASIFSLLKYARRCIVVAQRRLFHE